MPFKSLDPSSFRRFQSSSPPLFTSPSFSCVPLSPSVSLPSCPASSLQSLHLSLLNYLILLPLYHSLHPPSTFCSLPLPPFYTFLPPYIALILDPFPVLHSPFILLSQTPFPIRLSFSTSLPPSLLLLPIFPLPSSPLSSHSHLILLPFYSRRFCFCLWQV